MKDKKVIYHGKPCEAPLASPAIRTWDNLVAGKAAPCQLHGKEGECSPPRYGCVQMAGVKVARYVIEFYEQASEETLDSEIDQFRRYAPLPPNGAEAYVDVGNGIPRRLTDAETIVARVREYARTLLDLQPGNRRSSAAGKILGGHKAPQRKGGAG